MCKYRHINISNKFHLNKPGILAFDNFNYFEVVSSRKTTFCLSL